MPSRIVYFDCFSGAGGDMLLSALLDAGLPLERLQAELDKLQLEGYELELEHQVRHGIAGSKLHVRDTLGAHPARHPQDVYALIEASTLPPEVKARSRAVFARLARAEASVHGIPEDEIHFHEVGAVDSIVDIVGVVAGLHALDVTAVYASPLPLGGGFIEIEHGRLPVPAPATLALLSEVGAPTVPHPAQTELVTPTAAAILAELARFQRPPMKVHAVGIGFGDKQFPWPNGLRVWLGEPFHPAQPEADQVVLLECNLDDVTGEALGYTMERLFAAGALDVWFTPIFMKKNRPATMLSVLAPAGEAETLGLILLRETPTLGLRITPPMHRWKTGRRVREVQTVWGAVRVKEKLLGDEVLAAAPEYEDCARIAREHGVPLAQVYTAVQSAATEEGGGYQP
ncbi:MAG: nickel pincer cofactor biosynthesis protein LarC [Anaerolineae bacterium]|nr:nickel pincer cofactor biosynthesis protein LarC [Anaerolineae bacterium]